MHQRFKSLSAVFILVLTVGLLAACGSGNQDRTSAETPKSADASAQAAAADKTETAANGQTSDSASGERTIEYLGKTYTVPAEARRIVITGAMEAMEDAVTLDVHPIGAITYAGKFPEQFASITDNAQSIGEKTEPNFETILSLKPDVILGTTKFPEETAAQLEKIAPTILVSHISSDWQDNLKLMGELTGKQTQAQAAIDQYAADVENAKSEIGSKTEGRTVMAVRVRQGSLYVYPADVFVNAILYGDLGIAVPEIVASAKAQQEISVEQLAEIDPDELFVQFSENENGKAPKALDELESNPIVQQLKAYKDGTLYVNAMNPLSEGGPAWSRDQFLKAAAEKLAR
ncbi:iron-uptake system-binding protein [Saccharibacillus sp. O23]|uniref:ABC transporter substrate-binding protein n=1 Tax=Saccharibacillus sp. O23 TaxID=2009338 RepID=UPI000B4E01D3|nr:ABC transporter substrate-binding protein [Saccharibacillus sp. O23]OWR31519.1 iron-uptake system-binding protein [Saccharibacillus sp. O23]